MVPPSVISLRLLLRSLAGDWFLAVRELHFLVCVLGWMVDRVTTQRGAAAYVARLTAA